MPLIFNGTTIPENAANVFNFNGVNITKVIFNGTTVWTQSLFSATWGGGSSYVVTTGSFAGYYGMNTSGSLMRYRADDLYGAWIGVNSSGIFDSTNSFTVFKSYSSGFIGSGNTLRYQSGNTASTSVVYFNVGSGFSGTSAVGSYSLSTSSGLIRFQNPSIGYGAWLSLT